MPSTWGSDSRFPPSPELIALGSEAYLAHDKFEVTRFRVYMHVVINEPPAEVEPPST